MPSLHDPITLGTLQLSNRIIMAPLTRCRSAPGRVPTELMADYYRQRAGAGMILSEATAISPMAVGYPDTPGLWSKDQVEGWKHVTDEVHKAGGIIVAQLWHVGRISDPYYLDGKSPVAPSAIAPDGHVSLVRPKKAFETPRAMTGEEITATIEDYRIAAENAKRAGFDGVEIHGANGYLPEQFLRTTSNQREDDYGGSISNRCRFILEATDAAISVWGAERVGVHLSPQVDPTDTDPGELYVQLSQELKARNVAFIFLREPLDASPRLTPLIRKSFGFGVIANQALEYEDGQNLLDSDQADAASWGRQFIANPDLPERFKKQASLNEPDPETFYGGAEKGFTDYPFLADEKSQSCPQD